MKNKPSTLLTIIFTGLLFMIIGTLTAAEKQAVPDEIAIENDGYKSDKKGPVKFSHRDHSENYDVSCNECHHEYQGEKNVWEKGDPVKKCVDCHSPLKSQDKVKKLKLAFHKNCKNCHKELSRKGISKDAPFKKCGDCHEKKS
ncbi:MAG: cytochrome c3 family protein [Desulfobacteraceae bacterium]|jgi:hypothetical protein